MTAKEKYQSWVSKYKREIFASLIGVVFTLSLSAVTIVSKYSIEIANSPKHIKVLKKEIEDIKNNYVTKEKHNAEKDRLYDELQDIKEVQKKHDAKFDKIIDYLLKNKN